MNTWCFVLEGEMQRGQRICSDVLVRLLLILHGQHPLSGTAMNIGRAELQVFL